MENLRLRKGNNSCIKQQKFNSKYVQSDELKEKENHNNGIDNKTNEKGEAKNQKNCNYNLYQQKSNITSIKISFEIDLVLLLLFVCALLTRIYKLEEPKNIV